MSARTTACFASPPMALPWAGRAKPWVAQIMARRQLLNLKRLAERPRPAVNG